MNALRTVRQGMTVFLCGCVRALHQSARMRATKKSRTLDCRKLSPGQPCCRWQASAKESVNPGRGGDRNGPDWRQTANRWPVLKLVPPCKTIATRLGRCVRESQLNHNEFPNAQAPQFLPQVRMHRAGKCLTVTAILRCGIPVGCISQINPPSLSPHNSAYPG